MRNIAISTLLALLIGSAAPFVTPVANAQTAAEAGFNMNYVIGDDQMRDYLSMSQALIQEFLNTKTGILKSYTIRGKSVAQLIYENAVLYQINPRVILVTLQKEQSLITQAKPSQRALDFALGYGCFESTGCSSHAGLDQQIEYAAWQYDRYLDNIAAGGFSTASLISRFGPGVSKNLVCDSGGSFDSGRGLCTSGQTITVTPANAATAALYTYTPHPGGNYSFWSIWKGFNFNLRRVYPDGTLLQAKGSKDVYIIQNGQKRRFSSQNTLLATYSLKKIITVSADALMQYDTGSTIYFANYSLVTAPNRGVYLIANDVKRPIKSKAALLAIGIDPKTSTKAGWDVLNQFPDGAAITTNDIYPAGAIVQNTKNGMIFYVKDGIKYPVPSGDIYKSQFGNKKPIKLKPEVIDTYTWGSFVGFRDGELVQSKTGGAVYFISNGYRLPIASRNAAKAYGFDKIMGNLIKTNDKSIEVHPLGPALDVDSSMVSIASR